MNANELSETDVMANTIKNLTQKVRQQQAEIEALKSNMNTATNELLQQLDEIEALKGEVAHLKHINKNWSISEGMALAEIEALKAKTLTDEEIMDCIEDKTGYSFNACDEDLLDFARAILRKAQEK
jgi:predicted RNase H-like nuclease (RuvC/YqgF family)